MKNKIIIFLLMFGFNGFGQGTIIRTLPSVDNTPDIEKPVSIAQRAAIDQKKHVVSSIAELQAWTGTIADFDGTWKKKSGDVQSNGGGFPGTLIRVSSTIYWERELQNNIVTPEMFGGVNDNSTDNYTALYNSCNYVNKINGILKLKNGTYLSSMPGPFIVTGNTQIVGDSNGGTVIKSSGVNYIFSITNSSNVEIKNIKFVGSGNYAGVGTSGAININQDASANNANSNYVIENCTFENFRSQHWILATNSNPTFTLSQFKVNNCFFYSKSGNVVDGTNIGIGSSCLYFQGNDNGAIISNITVTNNYADCYYIKNFVTVFTNASNYTFSRNKIYNTGSVSTINSNTASYAINCYGVLPTSPLNSISENEIIGVKSCGIYTADGFNITIRNNNITGQTDTGNGILPKGGISINGGNNIYCISNVIQDCYVGISVVGYNSISSKFYLTDNTINNSEFSGIYGKVTGTGSTSELHIDGIRIINTGANARGIFTECNNVAAFKILDIKNFAITTQLGAIESFDGGNSPALYTNVVIETGTISGIKNFGIRYYNCNNANTNIHIKNVKFLGDYVGSAYNLLSIGNTRGLNINNIAFQNTTTLGLCIDSELSQGVIENITYQNCANNTLYYNSGNVDLGVDKPTWISYGANYVQNLKQTEAGTTGSKYIITGWSWDKINSVWLDNRYLTGN